MTPELREIRQLFLELRGRQPEPMSLQTLDAAFARQHVGPSALLPRLRELKQRGRKYSFDYLLINDIAGLYWIK